MGATLEWDCIPFTLTTPQGDLDFNTANALGTSDGGYYLLQRENCQMGFPLRVTIDDVSADDGSIPHKVLAAGYRVSLAVELWDQPGVDGEPGSPAKGETLVAMNDLLMRHLNRCRDDGQGRLTWNPSGDSNAERMVDDLWWDEDAVASNGGGNELIWVVTFGMVSPFPYAMIAAETVTNITDGGTQALDNIGSARFYPVIKAYGPTSEFTISNDANDGVIHYDAAQPGASAIGGGNYVEIDCFRNTVFLNGDVANRLPGIDPLVTEFFKLEIGVNNISVDGCDIDVLWQPAFA